MPVQCRPRCSTSARTRWLASCVTARGRRQKRSMPAMRKPAGQPRSRSASACSSRNACRSMARCRAPVATPRSWPSPMVARAARAARRSIATRHRCGTRCTSAGTAGTAPPTACGRKRSGRSSMRVKWPPTRRTCTPRSRATVSWPAATRKRSARRPRVTMKPCWSMRPRRSAPSSARCSRGAPRSTIFVTRWRAAISRPRPATHRRHNAARACSSAVGAATCATWGRCSPTASSAIPACRFSCARASSIRGATVASPYCAQAHTTCCRAGAMPPTHRPRSRPATCRRNTATSASSRYPACATWR